jgi:hypothetical protein
MVPTGSRELLVSRQARVHIGHHPLADQGAHKAAQASTN